MKTKIIIQTVLAMMLLLNSKMMAQTNFLNRYSKTIEKKACSEKKQRVVNLNFIKTKIQKNKKKYTPTFSMDLLDGKGIHLFTISKVNFLPTIRVGIDVNVGLSITL